MRRCGFALRQRLFDDFDEHAAARRREPAGNTAHRSIGGSSQSVSTACAVPDASSGENIQRDATANPMPPLTAVRIPSAALTRRRPEIATATSEPLLLNNQASPPPRRAYTIAW